MNVKCLSVKQPYAHHIIFGGQDVENRTWRTKYRGRLYIHASGKKQAYENMILHSGYIIGYVDVVDCVQNSQSDWACDDSWHWILENPVAIDPILCKGQLSIFNRNLLALSV